MKKNYFKLDKKEKLKIKENFLKQATGKNAKYFLQSSSLYGILCIIFGLYIIIDAIRKNASLLEKIWGLFVFAAGVTFIVLAIVTFYKKLNKYINKK